jgi:hypothetical protein
VARVIEAHRLAQGTTRKPKARRSGKLGLVRALLESGMGDAEIREVMRLVHWLLALPEEEELEFRKDVFQGFRGVGILSIGPSELEFG